MRDNPEALLRMMDEGDSAFLGWCYGPSLAEEVDSVVGVYAPMGLKSQVQIEQGLLRRGLQAGAFLSQGLSPSVIWTQSGGSAQRGVVPMDLHSQ